MLDSKPLTKWHDKSLPMSEDCLQLNMWVPKNTSGAVVVFIFGGDYYSGSPSLKYYNGAALASMTKAIIININYRLGVLGFGYYKGKKYVSGNMGLLDQQMALRWIKGNIKNFGGNPSKVALFGHEVGAVSATAHLYAPNSKGLFNKIFASSGTVQHSWGYEKNSVVEKNFIKLMKKVKCYHASASSSINCMQKKNVYQLVNMTDAVEEENEFAFTKPFLIVEKDEVFFKGNLTSKII
uniref:COesterase domain-containing protein n=1 Tax=Parastrongyloides trichosuri TaxID=131310 RepID=A0A0N4ZGG5_PARTI